MSDPLSASAASAEDQLAYIDEVLLRFTNGSTQWVSIKRFTLPTPAIEDRKALGLLLRHSRYRDSYAGTGDMDMVSLHGPYRLDAISLDSFSRADPDEAEAKLRDWAEQDAPLDVTRELLERELYPRIRAATRCYKLDDLGDEPQHDWGWVVGQTGFLEFVLISHEAQSLELLVASDD